MAIRLEKGQRINLEKAGGQDLRQFCVGCNWGGIPEERSSFFGLRSSTATRPVDLDLSCIMLDGGGNLADYIYSPEYRKDFLASNGRDPGKLISRDGGLRHSGDDRKGDEGGDDGLDNEIITVDLNKVAPHVEQIFFFLNNVGKEDFSQIPYASIRMYEGTPSRVGEVFAAYDVAADSKFSGHRALIMGKLYRRDGKWRFAAIGDACRDANLCETINRILTQYK